MNCTLRSLSPARTTSRPIRPNPLIPTRIAISDSLLDNSRFLLTRHSMVGRPRRPDSIDPPAPAVNVAGGSPSRCRRRPGPVT